MASEDLDLKNNVTFMMLLCHFDSLKVLIHVTTLRLVLLKMSLTFNRRTEKEVIFETACG